MEKKIKRIKGKNARKAWELVREGQDFSYQISANKFIQFVGGMLTKVEDGHLFEYVRGVGWVDLGI